MSNSKEIKQCFLKNMQDTKFLEEYLFELRNDNLSEAVTAAVSLLSDSSVDVRAYAMWLIEMLKPSTSDIVPDLLNATLDTNLYVRSHAIVYLVENDLADTPNDLINVLEDGRIDTQTRCRAAIALGHKGGTKSIHALSKCLDDENPTVVWHAIHALSFSNRADFEGFDIPSKLKQIQQYDLRITQTGLSLAEEAAEAIRNM